MNLKSKILLLLTCFKKNTFFLQPEKGYDLLSNIYDNQPNNLLHTFDALLLQEYEPLLDYPIENSLDFGAGTGRNIPFLKKHTKNNIFACDISKGMIEKLEKKFPDVIAQKIQKHKKPDIPDNSIDFLICNLTIGYLKNPEHTFDIWDNLLKPASKIIITDIHPALNNHNLSRNFKYEDKNLIISSKNHVKPKLDSIFKKMNWKIIDYREIIADPSVRKHFFSQGSYESLLGKKILFGYVLQKK